MHGHTPGARSGRLGSRRGANGGNPPSPSRVSTRRRFACFYTCVLTYVEQLVHEPNLTDKYPELLMLVLTMVSIFLFFFFFFTGIHRLDIW